MSIEKAEEEAGSGWDTKAGLTSVSGSVDFVRVDKEQVQNTGFHFWMTHPYLGLPRRRAAPWLAKRLSGLLSARPGRDGERLCAEASQTAWARGTQEPATVCWGDLQKMGEGCSGKAWPQESVFLIRVAGGEAHCHKQEKHVPREQGTGKFQSNLGEKVRKTDARES